MKKKHYFQEQIEISERYGNPFTFKTTQEETVAEPKTYEEAVSWRQAKYWKQAMQAKFESLENNNTSRVKVVKHRFILYASKADSS